MSADLFSAFIGCNLFAGLLWGLTHLATKLMSSAAGRNLAWLALFLNVLLCAAWLFGPILADHIDSAYCPTTITTIALPPWAGPALFLSWAGGAISVFMRAALGRLTANRWLQRSSPLRPRDLAKLRASLHAELQGLEVRIAAKGDALAPITWGVWKPVILLPEEAYSWDASRLRVVLLHEIAHVRRVDNGSQLLALLVCALFWFNPLLWLSARRLEAESEIAADDLAIAGGVKPSEYAQELLALAAGLGTHRARRFCETAMVTRSTLEERLRTILKQRGSRGELNARSLMAPASVFICGVIALGLLASQLEASSKRQTTAQPSCLPP
ncbi:MAG TPA: M56 family metallopeptidase [Methylomirabilota bacterium]|nr:M56 family metallopeptidase [Methylomirabilota bacterium]